jgi:hypothetical protein
MSPVECHECLATLLEYSCQAEFAEQMQIARDLYSLATGKVNDDDPFYESRMGGFHEHFLFDYRLADVFSGATVFELFLLNAQTTLSLEDMSRYEQLRSVRQSLFRVEKVKEDGLVVTDLLVGDRILVSQLPQYGFDGFNVGSIFQGRTLFFTGRNYFTGAFVFHPKEVTELIVKLTRDFLKNVPKCLAKIGHDWRHELQRRHELLSEVADQKKEVEGERRRAIDFLKVNKQLLSVSREVISPNLVMALGRDYEVSSFVPESPFYLAEGFLQRLAYCQLRAFRYRHIDPLKVYDLESEHFNWAKSVSVPNVKKTHECCAVKS